MRHMLIDIITLFPEMFKGPFDESIIKRALTQKLVRIKVHNLRTWVKDKHKIVDDEPYGGGVGMILKPEPIFAAVSDLKKRFAKGKNGFKVFSHAILLTPDGRSFNFRIAGKLAALQHLILICGRYEGVDERVHEFLADEKLSIGDYILSGGELPAMVLTEAVARLIPGVLGKAESKEKESFSFEGKLLKYPQYTRPEDFLGMKVPAVLLSGNHQAIQAWRKEQAQERTRRFRPDLLQ